MGKPPKPGLSSRERIATTVLTRLSRKRLPDHLAVPGTVHETPGIFQATVAGISELNNLNPSHAAYVYAHNMASELAERCTAWKEMSPFVKLISRAEDMYMPGGPPLSPLTMSFFSCWSIFDACVGALVLIYAFTQAPAKTRRGIMRLVRSGIKRGEIQAVVDFVRDFGGIDYALQKAYEHRAVARENLASLPASRYKSALETFADYVVERAK